MCLARWRTLRGGKPCEGIPGLWCVLIGVVLRVVVAVVFWGMGRNKKDDDRMAVVFAPTRKRASRIRAVPTFLPFSLLWISLYRRRRRRRGLVTSCEARAISIRALPTLAFPPSNSPVSDTVCPAQMLT